MSDYPKPPRYGWAISQCLHLNRHGAHLWMHPNGLPALCRGVKLRDRADRADADTLDNTTDRT